MATTKKVNASVSKAGNARKKLAIEWRQQCARIFKYDSSAADQRYFKNEIANWLQTPFDKKPTWAQLLFNMVHKRNNGGLTLKYCHFNDHHQCVFIDKGFRAWADYTRKQLEKVLKQIHGA